MTEAEAVRPSGRQAAWLLVIVLLDGFLLSVAEDAITFWYFFLLTVVPLLALVGRGFRTRTLQLETRFWNWWRGASVFDTGARAMFVAGFYPFIPLVSLGLHLVAARQRRQERRLLAASRRPAATEDPGVSAERRARRDRRWALRLYGAFLAIMVLPFWIMLTDGSDALRADPTFALVMLVMQVLILVPALFAFDPRYRARFVRSYDWLRDQWAATSERSRSLVAVFTAPFVFLLALIGPAIVLVLHLRDRRRPGDASPPAGEQSAGVEPVSDPTSDPTQEDATTTSDDAAPTPSADVEPEPPSRRAWGGGQSAG